MRAVLAALLLSSALAAPALAQEIVPIVGSASSVSITPAGTLSSSPNPCVATCTLTGTGLALTGGTLTGPLTTAASIAGAAPLIVPFGTAPTSPVNGALWATTLGLFFQGNGGTIGPLNGATAGSGCNPAGANNSFVQDTGVGTCKDYGLTILAAQGGTGLTGGTQGDALYFNSATSYDHAALKASWAWAAPSSQVFANGTLVVEPNFTWLNAGTTSGNIVSVDIDNVAGTGAFTVGILRGGSIAGATSVTCNGTATIAATSTQTNYPCSVNTGMNQGDVVEIQITGVTGSPYGYVKVNYTHTVN